MGRFDIATQKKPYPEQQKVYAMNVEEEVSFLMESHGKAIGGLANASLKEAEKKFADQLKVMRKSKQVSQEAYRAICIIYKIKEDPEATPRNRNYSTGCSSNIMPSRTC
jgi:hypothetical protein